MVKVSQLYLTEVVAIILAWTGFRVSIPITLKGIKGSQEQPPQFETRFTQGRGL